MNPFFIAHQVSVVTMTSVPAMQFSVFFPADAMQTTRHSDSDVTEAGGVQNVNAKEFQPNVNHLYGGALKT